MQNLRRKAHRLMEKVSMKKAVAYVFSVAMAAVIFWMFAPDGNMGSNQSDDGLTVAEYIRKAGDVLTASADPRKFTGSSIGNSMLAERFLSISNSQSSKISELAEELADHYLKQEDLAQEDLEEEDLVHQILKQQAQVKGEFTETEVEEDSVIEQEPIPEEEEDSSDGADKETGKETKTVVEQQVIEHEVQIRETSLLPQGQERILQWGADGLKTVVYEQQLVKGEVRGLKILSETIDKEPITEVKLVGVAGAAVSPLDFGIELDEQGVPVSYSRVLTNQIATGYNAGAGAWGASGQTLSAGYVAVHPREIPYGTRMYITSADNSFVYGFAVAADTGVSLLGDVIDVDLYYDTYLESCLNGRKYVNIYILD